jgi:hypothetical protein
MNMEMEMEWNSHIIKSGSVFGTYDFMISKGHTLAEMNYVIWDVEDNSYMPLVKAVAATLDTHPDILLKDVGPMRTAVEDDQAWQMQQRLLQERANYPEATQTGRELAQGGKPIQGAVQGLRNLFTGGRSSRGPPREERDVDAQAPSGQEDRYRKLSLGDRFNPISTLSHHLSAGKDNRKRQRASQTEAHQQAVMNRLLEGNTNYDDLDERERAEYDEAVRLIGGGDGDATRGRKPTEGTSAILENPELTRTVEDRKKDARNAKWRLANPNEPASEAPYPKRYKRMLHIAGEEPSLETNDNDDLDDGDEFGDDDMGDEEMSELVDGVPEGAITDTPVTDTPEEPVVAPREAREARDYDKKIDDTYARGNKSHKDAMSLVDEYKDGLGDEGATLEGLKDALTNDEGKFVGKRKDLYDALLDHFNITPKQAEKAVNTIAEDDGGEFGEDDIDDTPPKKKTKKNTKKTPPLDQEEYNYFFDAVRAGDKHPKYEQGLDWFKKNKKGVEKEGWDMPPMPKKTTKKTGQQLVDEAQKRHNDENKKPADDDEFGEDELDDDDDDDDDEKFDPSTFIASDDAINSAWDHLTLLKGR